MVAEALANRPAQNPADGQIAAEARLHSQYERSVNRSATLAEPAGWESEETRDRGVETG